MKIFKIPFAATGDRIAIPTVEQPSGEISQPTGWTPDYQLPNTDPNYKPVGRDEMNGVLFEITEALGQLQQFGFADWQSITGGWPIGANVNHGGGVWQSLANANTEEPGTGALWKPIAFNKLASPAESLSGVNQENLMSPYTTAVLFPFRGIQVYDTSGTHTWNVPAGVTKVWVTVVGAGGGGGGVRTTANVGAGAGGGGGGGGAQRLVDLTGVSSVSVTVGAGGAGGELANGWSGLQGGTSSFGAFCSATGGGGGQGVDLPGISSIGSGAGGGFGSGGDVSVRGNGGFDGALASPVSSSVVVGGSGGGAALLGGGRDGGSNAAGNPGQSGGEGGAGASASNGASFAGGAGAAGIVIIQW